MLSVPDYYHSVVMVRMYVVVLWPYSTWRTHHDTALFIVIHRSLQFYAIFNLSHTIFPHINLSNGVSEKRIEHHYRHKFTTRIDYYEFPIRMKRLRLAYSQRCVCVLHLKRICVRYEEKNKINFFGFRIVKLRQVIFMLFLCSVYLFGYCIDKPYWIKNCVKFQAIFR